MSSCKHILCILITAFFLTACGGSVSQENFNKIENAMSQSQVEAILGKPTNAESVNIAGFSGTTAVWKSGDIMITIRFLNGEVILKTLTKGEDEKS